MNAMKCITSNVGLVKIFTIAAFALSMTQPAHADTSMSQTDTPRGVARQLSQLTKEFKKVNASLDELKKKVASAPGTTPVATPAPITGPTQATVAANKTTSAYISFNVYPGISGNPMVAVDQTAAKASFILKEGGKISQRYDLSFPFANRTADQKQADQYIITNCVNLFQAVLANPEGGTFYIFPSADEKIGVACSNDLTVTHR
jgi:hypothetical protein